MSLRYSGGNSYVFVNGVEIIKLKTKDSEINAGSPLCLGNISKDFSVNNMKKTGFHGNVYDFSVNYDVTNDILDIHKYLLKKSGM